MRIAALAIALAVSAVSAPAQGPELALAQVRPDGILVPFAVFDGAKWVDAWPEPTDKHRLDQMIAAVPSYWRERQQQVPQVWHVAEHPSHKPRAIKTLSHVMFDEHCAIQVGLLTDVTRSDADAHDKRLAMSWPGAIEWPIDVLKDAPNRAPWQPLVDAALREAAERELLALRNAEEQAGRRLQVDLRADRSPFVVTKLYGFLENDRRIIYYEAERRYAKPLFDLPNAEPAAVKAAGWIVMAGRETARAFESQAEIGDSEFKNFTTLEPLGIIRPAGAGLWVVQEHGYESEAVSLLQIRADGIQRVFSKFVGGC